MKKILLLGIICLSAVFMLAAVSSNEIPTGQENVNDVASTVSQAPSSQDFVDLGLPSGTLWKKTNENCGYLTYNQAGNRYGRNLPTREQWQELISFCDWTWDRIGYRIVGSNGNSIFLPTTKEWIFDGEKMSAGTYWSSTPLNGAGSDQAWSVGFSWNEIDLLVDYIIYSKNVRLVR